MGDVEECPPFCVVLGFLWLFQLMGKRSFEELPQRNYIPGPTGLGLARKVGGIGN